MMSIKLGDRKLTGDEMPISTHAFNWFGLG